MADIYGRPRAIANYWKAIAGALAGAVGAAIPLVAEGLTLEEGLVILAAALTGSGLVYAAPANKPKRPV